MSDPYNVAVQPPYLIVIPAKAGIQQPPSMDPRFCGDDGQFPRGGVNSYLTMAFPPAEFGEYDVMISTFNKNVKNKKNLRDEYKNILVRQDDINRIWETTGQENLFKFFVKIVPQLLNSETCSIFFHDLSTEKIWLKYSTNLSQNEIEVSRTGTLVSKVITTGKFQIRRNIETDLSSRDILCVPIKSLTGEEVIGAIEVLNKKGKKDFSDSDRYLLEEIAAHFRIIIENIYVSQNRVTISKKINKKNDFSDIILKLWAAFLVIFIATIMFYFTPVVFKVFQR